MRKRTKQLLLIGGVIFGLFVAGSPFLISHAQKKSEIKKVENQYQDDQTRQARQEIAKSVVGSLMFDTILVKEPKWELNKANYVERGEHNEFTEISMLLKKGDNFIGIDILEFDSVSDADAQFDGLRSYGANVPSNKYGEKGDILIGQHGDLVAIRFRKGNFFVAISTKGDQKTADRFARYVLDSLSGSAAK